MRAFFLDRDGTLNVDTDFVHTPDEWQWCDNALKAISWMNNNHFKVIVVTNQSGISRGHYTVKDVEELHNWVDAELAKENLKIDEWLVAPHHPAFDQKPFDYRPEDRKPGKGMFYKAIELHGINPKKSFMAGDKITDLLPALELGMKPFFIRSRHELNQDENWLRMHDIDTFDSLFDAVKTIKNFR
jgi:D-glycero-D-manno-heptose 1,7-bisphosphate phosphatase